MSGETIGETRLQVVAASDPPAKVNRAIELPSELRAPDGRCFHLRSWEPSVCVEKAVSVKIEAIVLMTPDIVQPDMVEPKANQSTRIKNAEGGVVRYG